GQRASIPRSPVRMRITSSTGRTKIFPSPIFPDLAARSMASTTRGAWSSSTTISIFTLGRKSTTYSAPLYSSVWPRCRPNPFTSTAVRPWTPTSASASFTSSSLKGLMIASIFFIRFAPGLSSTRHSDEAQPDGKLPHRLGPRQNRCDAVVDPELKCWQYAPLEDPSVQVPTQDPEKVQPLHRFDLEPVAFDHSAQS